MKEQKWTWADYVDGGPELDQRLIKIAKLLKRMREWMNERVAEWESGRVREIVIE